MKPDIKFVLCDDGEILTHTHTHTHNGMVEPVQTMRSFCPLSFIESLTEIDETTRTKMYVLRLPIDVTKQVLELAPYVAYNELDEPLRFLVRSAIHDT